MQLRQAVPLRTACVSKPRSLAPVAVPSLPVTRLTVRDVRMAAATPSSDDFDALLMRVADKWEKAENKPAVAAYIAAAVAALWFVEWLIHLPGLDLLLGFPVQLVGVLALPVLAMRYYMDKVDYNKDVEDITGKIVEKLPGLKK